MYDWRRMTPEERHHAVAMRRQMGRPWHSPPHFDRGVEHYYIVSAACYEHALIVGTNPARMAEFEEQLLATCRPLCTTVHAWCVLPNHYHTVVQTKYLTDLLAQIGRLHGRSSHKWNKEDGCTGRQTWCKCFDRPMLSQRHFWVSLNYVHNNPVIHGYVKRWQDWPFSSAAAWLEAVGREKAEAIWRSYPILDYGKEWDV